MVKYLGLDVHAKIWNYFHENAPRKNTFYFTLKVIIIMNKKLTRHRIFSFKNGLMIEYTVYKYNGSLIKWNPWNRNGKFSWKNEFHHYEISNNNNNKMSTFYTEK